MAPKDTDPILTKSGVIYRYKCDGESVMKNTLESQQGHMLRGSRNIKRLLPQYMTTTTPLVILLP